MASRFLHAIDYQLGPILAIMPFAVFKLYPCLGESGNISVLWTHSDIFQLIRLNCELVPWPWPDFGFNDRFYHTIVMPYNFLMNNLDVCHNRLYSH